MDLPKSLGDFRGGIVLQPSLEGGEDARPVGQPHADHEGEAEAFAVAGIEVGEAVEFRIGQPVESQACLFAGRFGAEFGS